MNNKKVSTHAYDNCWHIDTLLHIGTMCMPDSSSSQIFNEFLDDAPFEKNMTELIKDLPFLAFALDQDGAFKKDAAEIISEYSYRTDKMGFIAKVMVQDWKDIQFDKDGEMQSASYSAWWSAWWVYGDTFEQVCDKAMAWVTQQQNEAIEQARKEKGIAS